MNQLTHSNMRFGSEQARHRLLLILLVLLLLTSLLAAAVAWSETKSAAGIPRWQGSKVIATGDGIKGPWRQNESRYDYVDDPSIALDERGRASVTWVEQDEKDVFFQRFSPENDRPLGKPVNVSRSPSTFSWLPRVDSPPNDPEKIMIVWQEIIFSGASHGGDILFSRSDDGGATFSNPINVSHSFGGDGKGRIDEKTWHNGSYDITAGKDGSVSIAWTEYDGPLWFSRSTNGGRTFSPPVRVTGSKTLPARGPTLAQGGDGRTYLAWTTGENASADILVASAPRGSASFGKPAIVAKSTGYSDAPKLAVSGDGTIHVAYSESSSGPFARSQIRYSRSTNAAQSFDEPRVISLAPQPIAESAGFPSLSIDSKGRIFVAWELVRDLGDRPRGLGMAISNDGGRNFSTPAEIPGSSDPGGGTNGSHQGLLMEKLDVNDRGMIAVVNSSLKPNEGSRVWIIRGRIGDGKG